MSPEKPVRITKVHEMERQLALALLVTGTGQDTFSAGIRASKSGSVGNSVYGSD